MANDTVYEIVNEQVLTLMQEKNLAPWEKPWNPTVGMPLRLSNGKAYRGLNVFVLGLTAQVKGYESPWWGTYDQLAERSGMVKVPAKGGKGFRWVNPEGDESPRGVRKGEKSTIVTVWAVVKTKEKKDDGSPKEIRLLRYYRVFNADQADNVKVPEVKGGNLSALEPIDAAEKIMVDFFARETVTLTHGGGGAYYVPKLDEIHLPVREAFDGAEEYYSTLFHEMTHSTGHASRVGREGVEQIDQFGSPRYSKEELIAEFGSAFLSGLAGIDHVTLPRQASYLKGWHSKLSEEPKWLVQAASAAQKAADYITGVTYASEAGESQNETQAA